MSIRTRAGIIVAGVLAVAGALFAAPVVTPPDAPVTASKAEAYGTTYARTCDAPGAWTFTSTMDIYANVASKIWEVNAPRNVGYKNPGWLGLEWRVRAWYTSGPVSGSLITDTGYQTDNVNRITFFTPNAIGMSNAGIRNNAHIQVDAGRLNDGQPTCAMHIYLTSPL